MAAHAAYGGKGPMAPSAAHYSSGPNSAQPTPSGSGAGDGQDSDVDMSESGSSAESSGEDYALDGAVDDQSDHNSPKPKPKPKPSRKIELPDDVDADLYGLRRSVSSLITARTGQGGLSEEIHKRTKLTLARRTMRDRLFNQGRAAPARTKVSTSSHAHSLARWRPCEHDAISGVLSCAMSSWVRSR